MAERLGYDLLKKLHPNADWQRIEPVSGSGVADSNACYKGVEVWVELKEVFLPKRDTTLVKVKFQPGQIPWLLRRRKCGGRSFVMLRVVGLDGKAQFMLFPGECAKALAEGMTTSSLKIFHGARGLEPKDIFTFPLSDTLEEDYK